MKKCQVVPVGPEQWAPQAPTTALSDPLLSQDRLRCMRFLSVNCPEMRAKVLDQPAVALSSADVKPL